MVDTLLQNPGGSPMDGVSTTSNDVKKSSALSRTETLSIGGMILTRALMPLVTTTAKYGAIGYAIHELGKQSHTINAIESLGIGIITWMGIPFTHIYEKGFSSESVASLFIVGVVGFTLFFARSSKFNFIGKDIARLIGDAWFSFQYLGKTFAQYRKDEDKKSLKKRVRKYFSFFSLGLDYFSLTKLERELVLSGNLDIVGVYMKVVEYFKKHFNVTIVNFDPEKSEYRIHRPKDMKSDAFEKFSSQDMLHFIGLDIHEYDLSLRIENTIVLRISPKRKKETIFLKDYIQGFEKGRYYFGVDMQGGIISQTLSSSKNNSLGVYGKSGSGKSNATSGLFYSLYALNKNAYTFFILDTKGEFSFAKGLDDVQYAYDLEEILRVIDEVILRMETIQARLHTLGMHNLEEYLKKVSPSDRIITMRPMFFFIEELSYLLDRIALKYGAEIREEYANRIANLVCLGRSAGLTMIISTQKPLADMIGGSIVKEMITPISFKTPSETLIFQQKTGFNTNALEVGEAIYEAEGGNHVKFQSFYVDDSLITNLKNHYFDSSKLTPINRYLAFARDMRRFSFEDSKKFGVSKSTFDNCSRELQESGELKKTKSNHLKFSDDTNLEQE